MDATSALTTDEATHLLARPEPLNPDEMTRLLRYLKHANDDLVGKLRQLKSEIGRVARR